MSETKVQPTHLRRAAVVYVRQSTVAQVEQNRESTRRQYDLAERARQFGWRTDQITVLDEDLGLSAATTRGRGGFARMTAQVALGHVGILLGLEVSRLARNNADWYRLHLLSECRRVRRSRLRHRGLLLLAKRIGVHGTGATPLLEDRSPYVVIERGEG